MKETNEDGSSVVSDVPCNIKLINASILYQESDFVLVYYQTEYTNSYYYLSAFSNKGEVLYTFDMSDFAFLKLKPMWVDENGTVSSYITIRKVGADIVLVFRDSGAMRFDATTGNIHWKYSIKQTRI